MHAVYRREFPPGPAGRWLIDTLKHGGTTARGGTRRMIAPRAAAPSDLCGLAPIPVISKMAPLGGTANEGLLGQDRGRHRRRLGDGARARPPAGRRSLQHSDV